MNENEMIEKKKEVEGVIEHLLHNFMNETGFIPQYIEVSQIIAFGNKRNTIAGINIVVENNEYPAFHVG